MHSAPCRVLYLNHGAKLSGAELALRRLLGALDRGRVTPVVAFGEDGPMRAAMREAGVETHVLPLAESVREVRKDTLGFRTLLPGRRLAAAVAYAVRVARFARRENVQLIHSNTIKAHLYGALAGQLAGLPVIWHLRDLMGESYFPANVVRGMRWGARHLPTHIITVSGEVRDRLCLNGSGHRATGVHDGLGAEELTSAPGVAADDETPGFGSPVRIGKQRAQGGGEGGRITHRGKQPVLPVGDDFRDAPAGGGNHRFPRGHSFDDDLAEGLPADGSMNQHVESADHRGDVVTETEEAHPLGETQPVGLLA